MTEVEIDFPVNPVLIFQAINFDQEKRYVYAYRNLQKM
jgi:hypothetical protein